MSSKWLHESERVGAFVWEGDFPVHDRAGEAKLGINMQASIRRGGAGRAKIMTGMSVFFTSSMMEMGGHQIKQKICIYSLLDLFSSHRYTTHAMTFSLPIDIPHIQSLISVVRAAGGTVESVPPLLGSVLKGQVRMNPLIHTYIYV